MAPFGVYAPSCWPFRVVFGGDLQLAMIDDPHVIGQDRPVDKRAGVKGGHAGGELHARSIREGARHAGGSRQCASLRLPKRPV
jgi:hypothetical protein